MTPEQLEALRSELDREGRREKAKDTINSLVRDMGRGAMVYFPMNAAKNLSAAPLFAYEHLGTSMSEGDVADLMKTVAAEQRRQGNVSSRSKKLGADIFPGATPSYNPASNTVQLNKNRLKRGIVAHEAGHAVTDSPLLNRLGHYGSVAGRLSLIPAAFTKDEDLREGIGIAGSAAMSPQLLDELRASYAGSKLLKRKGVTGVRRLSSFAGVPTYAAATALPYLMAKARGWLDKYLEDRKDVES